MEHFGTDGIRGESHIFTEAYLSEIGKALVFKFGATACVMARDTRVSGERIARTLGTILSGYGVRVLYAGILPTPALAYLTRVYGAGFGIMVSASHNPPEYNGIKVFGANGGKITTEEETEIEEYMLSNAEPRRARGSMSEIDGGEEYITHFSTFAGRTLKNMRLLLDTANGATGALAPEFFRRLGCYVEAVNGQTDGVNINVNCGATHPETLLKTAQEGSYDFAFAFDGDGDRVIGVRNGKVIDGDKMLFVISRYLYLDKGVEPPVAVGTLTTNGGTEASLNRLGIKLERADVGDKYVYERMLATGAPVGGEKSGHIIINDLGKTGDGIVTAMTLCLAHADVGFDFLDDMVTYPVAETEIFADDRAKEIFRASEEIKNYVASVTGNVRLVVRPSGTEPKIRITAEAESYEKARKISDEAEGFINRNICNKIKQTAPEYDCSGSQNGENAYKTAEDFESAGVTVKDISTTFVEKSVTLGAGVVLYPMVALCGNTKVGSGTVIYSFTDITDTKIGNDSLVRSVYAVGAKIGSRTTVGPFACLRKGAVVGDDCRVGDYVEVKNAVLGNGVKSAHLAYIGDAEVGEGTNVGCGTVFANYDGKIKQRTRVGKHVFIGCNANLIAPLDIGDEAYIAGGSTVTEDVAEGAFCIARSRQTVKENRGRRKK